MPPPPVLNLSEVQSEQFYVLVNEHKIEMQSISDSQAEILTQYFKTLYEPNELSKEAALSNFCALENQKIQSTYNHFQDIQEMLNDDQLANFPEFIDKAMNHILRLKNKTSRPK